MKDAIGAIRDYLAAQSSISGLVEDRLFVNRLPRSTIEAEDTFHPRKMLVVRMAGGAGKAETLDTDDPTVNIIAYGESDFEADRVRRAVWSVLVNLARVRQGGVLIHHVNPTGGAVPLVDPDIVWPAISQSYSLKAAVMEEV